MRKAKAIAWLLTTARVAIAFWGYLALAGYGGPASPTYRVFTACLALVLSAAPAVGQPRGWQKVALVVGLAAVLPSVPAGLARHALYAIATTVVLIEEAPGLGPGLLFSALTAAALSVVPEFAHAIDQLATHIDVLLRPNEPMPNFGGTVTGLYPVFCCLSALAVSFARGPRVASLVGVAGCIGAFLVHRPLGELLADHVGSFSHHNHPVPLFETLGLLAGMLAVCVGVGHAALPTPAKAGAGENGSGWSWSVATGAAGMGLVLLLLTGTHGPTRVERSVAFLNYGGLNWKRPQAEEIGSFSSGMFGLLPLYLERAGWDVDTIALEDVEGIADLESQVLVMINSPLKWEGAKREAVETFIERGGSLLVLGDHTDVYGLMKGFNSLLAPHGIEFNFDSAMQDGASWFQDLVWGERKHGLGGQVRDLRVAVGASLSLSSPASPVIVGRYAFADDGIRANVPGAFLGDYEYKRGERLGDVVLVAATRVGNGSVLVYGDTTAFQNAILPRSFATHVLPTFHVLSKRPVWQLPLWAARTLMAVLWGWLVMVCFVPRGRAWCVAAIACGVTGFMWNQLAPWNPGDHALNDGAFLVDESLSPNIGDLGYKWNSIYPIQMAALRGGLFVQRTRTWESNVVANARTMVLAGPREELSGSQIDDLERCMAAGGTVLVLASGADQGGVSPLLARHGLAIDPHGIGSVPPRNLQIRTEPRFIDPSRLIFESRVDDAVLYSSGETTLALARKVGPGALVVIADTRFASSENVEGTWGTWPGNARFLLDLVIEYCGGDIAAVSEPFESPPSLEPQSSKEQE